MENIQLIEISTEKLEEVFGGSWGWSDIAGNIGYGVGQAGGWIYNNILIGDPWTTINK